MITEATRPAARRGDSPAAPATSVAPSTSIALPVTATLEPLRDLPGLVHACLLDEDGRVLAEIGTDGGTAGAMLAWGRRAGGVASDRGLALEDVIVTSDAAHHLLRAVDGAPSRGSWAYLRVDRDRGNLALARRRLAAVVATSAPAARPGPAVAPPAPRSAPRPPAAPLPAPGAIPLPAAAQAAPSASPAPHPMGGTFPRRVPERSTPAAAHAAAPAAIAAPPTSPPTRKPASSSPAPAHNLATDPPALPEPRRPAGQAPTTRPAGPVPPADLEHRRSPPQDSAGVLSQRWRTDPETLRRVLAGLLRLGRGSPPAGAPPHGPPPALPGR